ncbi:probable 2Fe-2S ferredoxin [Sphingobium indicum BiD32]|uniref:Probable 2Fe-2S ferredoxin n=1 Tax=Sphingobium indicum BiD32 TaxID=1301087 RepID=N1MNW7_9SPHN|nr:(2Fe-2S)-binding protein [Sphingobium indicum]CCW18429.1 probable 2Fe-2S ferredoxin [Sphingobium indicum BiD32]
MENAVSVTVNGRVHDKTIPIRMLLVDFLRDELGLTGTHVGCTYEGRCGACTVVVDGRATKSCMMLAVQANGCRVVTVEGLENFGGSPGALHPIQQGFWERHGLQCGYCTPGMMMTIFDILATNVREGAPELTAEAIRQSLVGNICRCTGYSHIVEAVQSAAAQLRAMVPEERAAWFDTARLGEVRA